MKCTNILCREFIELPTNFEGKIVFCPHCGEQIDREKHRSVVLKATSNRRHFGTKKNKNIKRKKLSKKDKDRSLFKVSRYEYKLMDGMSKSGKIRFVKELKRFKTSKLVTYMIVLCFSLFGVGIDYDRNGKRIYRLNFFSFISFLLTLNDLSLVDANVIYRNEIIAVKLSRLIKLVDAEDDLPEVAFHAKKSLAEKIVSVLILITLPYVILEWSNIWMTLFLGAIMVVVLSRVIAPALSIGKDNIYFKL